MVLDEELKMMTRICDADVKTFGPFLTPMSHLVHTGYRRGALIAASTCDFAALNVRSDGYWQPIGERDSSHR